MERNRDRPSHREIERVILCKYYVNYVKNVNVILTEMRRLRQRGRQRQRDRDRQWETEA